MDSQVDEMDNEVFVLVLVIGRLGMSVSLPFVLKSLVLRAM